MKRELTVPEFWNEAAKWAEKLYKWDRDGRVTGIEFNPVTRRHEKIIQPPTFRLTPELAYNAAQLEILEKYDVVETLSEAERRTRESDRLYFQSVEKFYERPLRFLRD
jgi:hypothetical protein